MIGAIGLFMGVLINAQIFSELAMIFSGMNKVNKEFQMKLTKMNEVMIELNLPFELRYEVLNFKWKTQPSLHS